MVQYAVLAWSHKQANLAEYTDNIRILEQLQSSAWVNGEQGSSLIDIYQAYRAVTHRLVLQEQSPLIQQTQLSTLFASYQLLEKKSHVETLWQEWVCDSPA
jgi:glutamate-ammonia-ligase adenylyltransferase